MPSSYGADLAQAFSQKLIKAVYEYAPIEEIVNRDYEGEIDAVGSKLNMLNFTRLTEQVYTGANLTPADLTEVNSQLTIDQWKSFYWREKTINKFQSYIKEPKGTILEQTANERKRNIMLFLLGFYNKVAAGSQYGTDYTTGTVSVDASGNVTGSGTTFTSSMVGCGFQATGQSLGNNFTDYLNGWYRVKSYTSATSIVIENDTDDDVASGTYTGPVIASGTSYVIKAATPKTIDNSSVHLLDMVTALKQNLDDNEVPDEDRYIFLPPVGITALLKDSSIKLNVPAAYEDLIVKGMVTELEGFKVFKVNRLTGNNTSGYRVLAGQKNFLTFADKALNVGMEEDLIGNFGSAYKDLFVYGAKVADERRKFGTSAYVTFNV